MTYNVFSGTLNPTQSIKPISATAEFLFEHVTENVNKA